MPISTPPAGDIHRLSLNQLALHLRESKQILTAWTAYSDKHSASETFRPFDNGAYSRRQSRPTPELNVAEQPLVRPPASDLTQRFARQAREPRTSADELYAGAEARRALRDVQPKDAAPGTEAYDGPLAESRAEGRRFLGRWAIHGQALIEVNTSAQNHRSGPSVPATVTPVPEAVLHTCSARW
ncbi:hypothetical protein [Streptomyces paludis]|uniref:Uncharacterized protein n=1 Tax=Streptomyces paludis TaxID=2282738 RepID=A0A345HVM8_9ACTN|nr:hypothetical protein [Streptomyces paludis]AXG80752.1 hypothetical protein DVK44_27195 [Streptomyces paludis]